jgi:uncharacterized membrane protein YvbJ
MFCPKCGNRVEEEMVFCPRCGASLKVDATIPPTQSKTEREQHEKREYGLFGFTRRLGVLIVIRQVANNLRIKIKNFRKDFTLQS